MLVETKHALRCAIERESRFLKQSAQVRQIDQFAVVFELPFLATARCFRGDYRDDERRNDRRASGDPGNTFGAGEHEHEHEHDARQSLGRHWAPYDGLMVAFDDIDTEKITRELDVFVTQTAPVATPAMVKPPACGATLATELMERVRPILDRLSPNWSEECPGNKFEPFAGVREACVRLRARIASHAEIDEMLSGYDASPQLSAASLHGYVWTAASAQWKTGHRHEAVLAASKAVNSMLQAKLDRRDVAEVKLVQEAFSEKDPAPRKPRLRFPEIEDEQTRESMRMGALSFGVGCFQAIRNPVGHLPNDENELSEQEALERLAAWSLFARWVEQATLVEAA
jgi:hypothetical protein